MADIYQVLESQNISYLRHDHPAVFTCDEADKHWINSGAAHTKNLFLRTEKAPYQYFLYILECKQRADLKKLAESLGLKRLTFAKDTELKEILDLTPGSVSPFGLINDTNHQVTVLIDQMLTAKYEHLLFHPNINTATLDISWPDFQNFLTHTRHHYQVIS